MPLRRPYLHPDRGGRAQPHRRKFPRTHSSKRAASLDQIRLLREELELEKLTLQAEHNALVASQRELEESRDWYATLFEINPLGFATLDRSGIVLALNKTGANLLGRNQASVKGLPLLVLLPKDSRAQFLRHLAQVRQAALTKDGEVKTDVSHCGRDGAQRILEFTSIMDHQRWQGLICIRTAFRDVTAQRQAEAELRQSREQLEERVEERTAELQEALDRLNDLYHHAPCGYHSLDSRGVFVEINDTALQLLGYEREELLGKRTIFELQSPKSRVFGEETFYHLIAKGAISDVELEFVRKDGSLLPVLLSATSVQDARGRFVRSRSSFIDLTVRKQMEKALQDSEARLQAILDNSPQMIFLKDIEGRYLHYNRQFGSAFHLSRGEAIGKTDFEVFPQPEAASFRAHDLKVIESGQPLQFEEAAEQNDGSHISIVSKFPIADAHGKVYAVGGIVTDITERKRLEAEVLRIGDHEQQRIAQDLHDGLGQQLAGIWFLSDILRRNLVAQSSPELPAASKIVDLLKTTVSQARNLARGLYPVSQQPNGLMVALEDLAAQVSELFLVTCRFVCPKPVLVSDNKIATNLYRIAQEATNNAFKHGQASIIEIELSAKQGRATLRISDDGVGLQKIRKEHKGMGLRTMNYRADLIGADFAIRKAGSRGTEVVCSMRA